MDVEKRALDGILCMIFRISEEIPGLLLKALDGKAPNKMLYTFVKEKLKMIQNALLYKKHGGTLFVDVPSLCVLNIRSEKS